MVMNICLVMILIYVVTHLAGITLTLKWISLMKIFFIINLNFQFEVTSSCGPLWSLHSLLVLCFRLICLSLGYVLDIEIFNLLCIVNIWTRFAGPSFCWDLDEYWNRGRRRIYCHNYYRGCIKMPLPKPNLGFRRCNFLHICHRGVR